MYALLKVRGVRVNLGNNEDCAPLQYAAVKGDPEVVRWLVRKGAKVRGEGRGRLKIKLTDIAWKYFFIFWENLSFGNPALPPFYFDKFKISTGTVPSVSITVEYWVEDLVFSFDRIWLDIGPATRNGQWSLYVGTYTVQSGIIFKQIYKSLHCDKFLWIS